MVPCPTASMVFLVIVPLVTWGLHSIFNSQYTILSICINIDSDSDKRFVGKVDGSIETNKMKTCDLVSEIGRKIQTETRKKRNDRIRTRN